MENAVLLFFGRQNLFFNAANGEENGCGANRIRSFIQSDAMNFSLAFSPKAMRSFHGHQPRPQSADPASKARPLRADYRH